LVVLTVFVCYYWAEVEMFRCGSLKKVLSAGVLALDALSAEEREAFMACASGLEIEFSTKKSLQNTIAMIKEMVGIEKQ